MGLLPATQKKKPRTSTDAQANYDQHLYSNHPYPETHPDRLATLGTLYGLSPAPPDRCRVLELGCGLGGNLAGMAVVYPGSQFVGIDQSARQIKKGQRLAQDLRLDNLLLKAQDILQLDPAQISERFDYIVCHGVYSWVPEKVQARILFLCRKLLSDHGVAYISYNTLPGWHMRGMVRDMLRRHCAGVKSPKALIARARQLLEFLKNAPAERSAAHAYMVGEVRLLDVLGDEYLLYEHLVELNQPVYFRDFASAAGKAGLQYLSDAELGRALPGRLGPEVAAACESKDIIETEQRMDFLDVRFFRRTLLCHKERKLDRSLSPERLRRFHVISRVHPTSEVPDVTTDRPEDFQLDDRRGIAAHEPLLKAALCALHAERPRGLPFDEMCAQAYEQVHGRRPRRVTKATIDKIAGNLVDLLALGFVDLSLGTPKYVVKPGERPTTTALARFQAGSGASGCTNLYHAGITVDAFDRALLYRMDGSLTAAQLAEEIERDVTSGLLELSYEGEPISATDLIREATAKRLEYLARCGFLIA